MQKQSTAKRVVTSCSALVMLLATLLPLVNAKSYRWNILELPHKMNRLVGDATYNTIGKVLIVALVALPLVMLLMLWLKGRMSRLLAMLPVLIALALVVILLMVKPAAPGIGLWLYLAAAVLACAFTLKRQ